MRRLGVAAAAVLVCVPELRSGQPPGTLLTLPQRDPVRSHSLAASASLSADGRYIAFSSHERLVPADEDRLSDIYVFDRATQAVTLESLTVEGVVVGADCVVPRLSANGRFLVFVSAVDSPGTKRAYPEVVWRDRNLDVSLRISRSAAGQLANGWSGSPGLSDDGQTVVFESAATNLVPGADANGERPDVYLVRRDGAIRRLSVDNRGFQSAAGASTSPTISGDARFVAFVSTASLTEDGPVRRREDRAPEALVSHVYVADTQQQLTTRISVPPGRAPNGSSYRPAISRDGAHVAFVSMATNWVPGDRNRSADVFVFDTRRRSVTLVSRGRNGRAANGPSDSPAISADGRFVVFQSEASDLDCVGGCDGSAEDINLLSDIFLFDRETRTTRLVSRGESGGWLEESVAPALDSGGRIVAFTSRHPIDERDIGHDFDLFVRIPNDLR